MRLTKRAQNIKESLTLAITARAKAMKAEGRNIIGFAAGEPDFDTPDNIKNEAIRAIKEGFTKYTQVGGIAELKDSIIDKFKNDNNLQYTKEEVIVSCGGKHSFFNLCQAFFEKGDEVIIPAPYWVSYPTIVNFAGGTPVIVHTKQGEGFKMTPKGFEDHITPATKAVLINSPSNPTGVVYDAYELKMIAEIALARGIFIISDEIYEKLCYDGTQHISIASLSEEIKKRTVILNGVSKAYAMTGWRIGYAAGPKELIKAMTKIQSQSTSNPTSISQKAAVEALSGSQNDVVKMRKAFDIRRQAMMEGLRSIDGVTCTMPRGAFYAFPNISSLLQRRWKGQAIEGSVNLAEFLLNEAEVAVVPGVAFGAEGYIRISYANSLEEIQEGIKRIRTAVEKLK